MHLQTLTMINIYKEDPHNLLLNLKIKDANMGYADDFKDTLINLFDTHQKKTHFNKHGRSGVY